MSTYAENLNAIKAEYPFDRWKKFADNGQNDWSVEECDEMIDTFNNLIDGLVELGEGGTEEAKIDLFEEAVDETNEWNGIVNTFAREDLVDLINKIADAAGLGDYDNEGEGLDSGRMW